MSRGSECIHELDAKQYVGCGVNAFVKHGTIQKILANSNSPLARTNFIFPWHKFDSNCKTGGGGGFCPGRLWTLITLLILKQRYQTWRLLPKFIWQQFDMTSHCRRDLRFPWQP